MIYLNVSLLVCVSDGWLSYWRVSEASETLSGVCKFELVRYVSECGNTLYLELTIPYP